MHVLESITNTHTSIPIGTKIALGEEEKSLANSVAVAEECCGIITPPLFGVVG